MIYDSLFLCPLMVFKFVYWLFILILEEIKMLHNLEIFHISALEKRRFPSYFDIILSSDWSSILS